MKQQLERIDSDQVIMDNLYFANPSIDYVYKASIEVFKNTFGGLIIIKKTQSLDHRVVFTTEMGNKIFDFSFKNDVFKVNYILDELNNPYIIRVLKNDFAVLVKQKFNVIKTYKTNNKVVFQTKIRDKNYFYFYQNSELNKIARVSKGKEKVVFLFSKINDNVASRINIVHNSIKLQINLKSIK